VNVGRASAIVALLLALVSATPLLGELDQAFLYIQEYSGFLYPGITIVFGLGLLWKRASKTAAIWITILTIPIGILFKLLLPHVAFIFREGYVSMILLVLFITISLCSQKTQPSQSIPKLGRDIMRKWSYILGVIAVVLIIAATIVCVGYLLLPAEATPENNLIAYLNDIGFQAFFFFGCLVGACAILLFTNAKSPKEDTKALSINLALFSTTRGYTYGAIIVCAISLIMYIVLW
jgi:SSS family solute:Na+ symporter